MDIKKLNNTIQVEGGSSTGEKYYTSKKSEVVLGDTPTANFDRGLIEQGNSLRPKPGEEFQFKVLSHTGDEVITKPFGDTGYGKPSYGKPSYGKPGYGDTGYVDPGEGGNTGIESDLGKPAYSWDETAQKQASAQLGKDIEDTRKQFIESRQQLEQLGREGQHQSLAKKYATQQSIDKAGWTGGYVLDAQRQKEYLKQSIAAQMYGQMELQSQGYDSQLAAARMAYDLGKEQLAMQYYKEAYERAVMQAEVTGIWITPEVSDMLNQYQAAEQILSQYDDTQKDFIPDEEYERAQRVIKQIDNWFGTNGISKEGIKTLAAQQLELDKRILEDSRIQAALDSAEPWQYILTDENGQYQLDPETGRPIIIDLSSADTDKAYEFYSTSQQGTTALKRYIDGLAAQTITDFIASQGDKLEEMSNEKIDKAIQEYRQTNDAVMDYLNEFDQDLIKEFLGGSYTAQVTINGKTYSYTLGDVEEPKPKGPKGPEDSGDTVDVIEDYTDTDDLLDVLTDPELVGDVKDVVDLIVNTDFESMGTSDWNNFWDKFFLTGFYVNAFGSGKDAKKTVAEINSILKQIDTAIGPDNMALMVNKNIEWNKLTDREKGLLSSSEKESYERNEAFITNYITMKEVLKEAEMNDSNIFSGNWEYTRDVWKRNAKLWKDADNFAKGANALLDSVYSVGQTGVDTIISVVRGLFYDWWK